MSTSRPFVRVLGVALTVGACHKAPPPPTEGAPPAYHNPPPPQDPAPQPPSDPPAQPPTNPPAPPNPLPSTLPTWDSVASGHPEGATNPPYPILVVTADTHACYKVWRGGMIPPPADVRIAHGRVVATAAEIAERGTEVQCPPEQPDTLLKAYAALPPDTQKGPL